jgi:hypothetical protein
VSGELLLLRREKLFEETDHVKKIKIRRKTTKCQNKQRNIMLKLPNIMSTRRAIMEAAKHHEAGNHEKAAHHAHVAWTSFTCNSSS